MLMNILYICMLTLIQSNVINLIKKGDFQNYATLPFYLDINYFNNATFYANYKSLPSNLSDWFDISMGSVQFVKQWTSLAPTTTTTIVVDLSSQIPITLCQRVNLVPNSLYKLSFDLRAPYRIEKIYGKTYLNQLLLGTTYIPTRSTTKTQVYIFQADRNQNILCFNETHSPAPSFLNLTYVGALIDNISLTLISFQKLSLSFLINQIEQSLYLIGSSKYNQSLIYDIENRYGIYIEQNQISYTFNFTDTGTIFIEIQENYSFSLQNVKLKEKIGYNYSFNEVYAQISLSSPPPTKKYFFYLQQNQVQTLKKSKQILIFINQIYSKISALCETFLFAYFLNMIIDLQVLSLFYIFTQIIVIPDFICKIYLEILRIVFSTQNLVQYSSNLLNIPLKNFNIQFQEIFPERINKLKNEESWFGTFGISSKVINGNFSNFLVLIMTFVKLVLMKLIFKLIEIFFPIIKVKIHILSQILTQFCFLLPVIIISMQANAIDSLINFNEKIYKIGCLFFIFISLILLFLYIFFHSYFCRKRISKNKQKKTKKKGEVSDKQSIPQKQELKRTKKRQIKILVKFASKRHKIKQLKSFKKQVSSRNLRMHFHDQAFSIFIIFFIPFMSLIGNSKLFLMINTFSVLFKFFAFRKQNHLKDILVKKIVDFLIGLVWIIHHSIFVAFFFYQNVDLSQNQIQIVIGLGIAATFTVTLIIMLQMFKFLIKFLRGSFRFLVKHCPKLSRLRKIQNKHNKNNYKSDNKQRIEKGQKKTRKENIKIMAVVHSEVFKQK